MTNGLKIGLIIGGVSVVGVGLYFLLRNRNQPKYNQIPPPPVQNGGNTGAPNINWGGIATTIIDSLPRNLTKTDDKGTVIAVTEPSTKTPLDTLLYVNAGQYNSSEIKSMQNYLLGLGGQSKMWVETTGGADGKIGNGFKTSYTWAVLSKKVSDINDLYNKSGAKK
tara:strand:+ start:4054 stop:4551 length:498 start_codon:yes stop_codon:yes gene_type:complete